MEDTGPGIAPELTSRIFNPSFSTKAQGTGQGLAIVQRILDSHGGSIEAVSRPDQTGARFLLRLMPAK